MKDRNSPRSSSKSTAPPFSFQAKERAGKITSNAGSALGRLLLLALGLFLVLIGVPMLILPGPGLLSIGVGLFCIVRAVRGPKKRGV